MGTVFEVEVQGKKVILDAADKAVFDQFAPWCLNHKGYVISTNQRGKVARNPSVTTVSLHREILQVMPGEFVDHINRDIYDNRRSNLRICTRSQNAANSPPPSGRKYKGVWLRESGRYRAMIRVRRKAYHLGHFDTAEEAASAYNKAAILHFGEFAHLNSIG